MHVKCRRRAISRKRRANCGGIRTEIERGRWRPHQDDDGGGRHQEQEEKFTRAYES